jgi:hypothetical protein
MHVYNHVLWLTTTDDTVAVAHKPTQANGARKDSCQTEQLSVTDKERRHDPQ